MPIGEIIGEIILRPILVGLSYLTGYIILKGITVGAIRLAPLSTLQEKNPGKKKWHQIDWSIWLGRPGRGRMLKSRCRLYCRHVGVGFGRNGDLS